MTKGRMTVGTWKGKVVTGTTEPGKCASGGRRGQRGGQLCCHLVHGGGDSPLLPPSFIESFISSPCGEGGPDTHATGNITEMRGQDEVGIRAVWKRVHTTLYTSEHTPACITFSTTTNHRQTSLL